MKIDWDLLSQIGDFIGGISTLFALFTIIFVLKQTKEMSKQNQIEAKSALISIYKEISCIMLEIDRMFIERPDLRKYFYDGADIQKDNKKYNEILSVAEYILDFMDMLVVMKNAAPEYPDTNLPWEDWNVFFSEIYSNSPIIRKLLDLHHDWYSKTLVSFFNNLPNELNENVRT